MSKTSIFSKTIILATARGANLIVSFLTLPFLARSFSYSEYGNYGQILLILSFFQTLFSFGLQNIVIPFMSDSEQSNKRVVFVNYSYCLILGLIGSIFIIIFNSNISLFFNNKSLRQYLFITSLSLPFNLLYLSAESLLVYKNKIGLLAIFTFLSNLFKIILFFISIFLLNSIEYFYYSMLIHSFSVAIFGLYFTKSFFSYFPINILTIKESFNQLKIGFHVGLTSILGIAFVSTDGWLISKNLGVEKFALFKNGAFEVPFLSSLYGTISTIILPEISKLFSSSRFKEIVNLKNIVTSLTAFLIFPSLIFILFFNNEVIIMLFSKKYLSSSLVFVIYNLILFIRINNYQDILIAARKTNYIPIVFFQITVFNFLLNLLLLNYFGIEGSAFATFISYLLLAYLLTLKSMKVIDCGFSDLYDISFLFKLLIISIFWSSTFFIIYNLFFSGIVSLISSFFVFVFVNYYTIIKIKLLKIEIIRIILPKIPFVIFKQFLIKIYKLNETI